MALLGTFCGYGCTIFFFLFSCDSLRGVPRISKSQLPVALKGPENPFVLLLLNFLTNRSHVYKWRNHEKRISYMKKDLKDRLWQKLKHAMSKNSSIQGNYYGDNYNKDGKAWTDLTDESEVNVIEIFEQEDFDNAKIIAILMYFVDKKKPTRILVAKDVDVPKEIVRLFPTDMDFKIYRFVNEDEYEKIINAISEEQEDGCQECKQESL
jgi:hypothetical protein